jgi:hypothetical protein
VRIRVGDGIRQGVDVGEVDGATAGQLHPDQVVEVDNRNVDLAELNVEGALTQLGVGAAAWNLVHHVDSAVARRYLSEESLALVLKDQGDEGREEVPALQAA